MIKENNKKSILVERINTKTWSSPVPEHIVNDCYKFFFEDESQWKEYFDNEALYVIGLSEDKYDYYWICINNKEKKLKFITCAYNIDKPCERVTKIWSKDERRHIFNEVKKYFKEHSDKENLIYLDEKIYKDL